MQYGNPYFAQPFQQIQPYQDRLAQLQNSYQQAMPYGQAQIQQPMPQVPQIPMLQGQMVDGIDNVKNKGFYVSTDDGYNAFPFIGVVKDKLVCVYSVGKNHTGNTSVDIFAKTSPNGVIWSKAKKIISTENVRDTITGLGHDSLGIIYFWNRKGTPVNADCSFDLYKTSDGIVFTKKKFSCF